MRSQERRKGISGDPDHGPGANKMAAKPGEVQYPCGICADEGHFHIDGLMLWLLAATNDGTRAGTGVDATEVAASDDARWPQCGVRQRAGPHQAGTESQLR